MIPGSENLDVRSKDQVLSEAYTGHIRQRSQDLQYAGLHRKTAGELVIRHCYSAVCSTAGGAANTGVRFQQAGWI